MLAKASPRTTPDKGRKARLSSPHWPLDVLRRGSCAPFVLPLLLPRPALSSSPLSRLGPCFGSNKLRRGSQLLRRRLQRTRDQPSPVSGLRQPLRHSILPGHSDRQRICTDGFNSCNNGCDALAAIPTAAAIQNQTACASRCCGQFKVCLGQRSRDVAAITCQ